MTTISRGCWVWVGIDRYKSWSVHTQTQQPRETVEWGLGMYWPGYLPLIVFGYVMTTISRGCWVWVGIDRYKSWSVHTQTQQPRETVVMTYRNRITGRHPGQYVPRQHSTISPGNCVWVRNDHDFSRLLGLGRYRPV